ncbi:MAG: hypothetical protein DMF99_32175 [Acidobacteria bacterium]|nr:MAG: hypothetical protein DMF99_32175 [Acidobacteriota bacterium]
MGKPLRRRTRGRIGPDARTGCRIGPALDGPRSATGVSDSVGGSPSEADGSGVNRRVSFRPEAAAETLETRQWYEARQPGLGAAFRAALDNTIEHVVENPLLFQRARGDTRRALLNRFPYAVYFRMIGEDIVVLAVHGRQHPRRWQARS